MLDLIHYAQTAQTHRDKAQYADTLHERMHWEAEAHRFEQLAEIAQTDPAAARRAYRPTRTYNPTIPHIREHGAEVEITTAGQGAGRFDRDKLATAYLLYLTAPSELNGAQKAGAVRAALIAEHGFDADGEAMRYALAAHYLIAANISL